MDDKIPENFIKTIKGNIEIIDKDFSKGYWEGLYFQAGLIEALLKFIGIGELKKRKKHDKNIENHIENSGLYNMIKDCVTLEVVDNGLHKKLEEYRKLRNILVHKMFQDPKYLEKLDLERMHELGKEILFELISIVENQ